MSKASAGARAPSLPTVTWLSFQGKALGIWGLRPWVGRLSSKPQGCCLPWRPPPQGPHLPPIYFSVSQLKALRFMGSLSILGEGAEELGEGPPVTPPGNVRKFSGCQKSARPSSIGTRTEWKRPGVSSPSSFSVSLSSCAEFCCSSRPEGLILLPCWRYRGFYPFPLFSCELQ